MNNDNKPENNIQDSQELMNQIILDYIRDQKHKRRWKWISRFFIILLIIFFFIKISNLGLEKKTRALLKPHVGMVEISGPIIENRKADADTVLKGLKKAFANDNLKALVLRINSPGGSPVQSEYIYQAIRSYKQQKPDVKIYAVCVDSCLSGAYYVASAADKIYASGSSLVGSIGVIYQGFGFVDTLDKLGMTRRLIIAGENKAILDPFSPESPKDVAHFQSMLDIIHQQFIERVKEGRKNRLHIDKDTFSGLFWTGEQAMGLGLIDAFGGTGDVMSDMKLDELIDYTQKPSFFDAFSENIGTAVANHLPEAMGLTSGLKL